MGKIVKFNRGEKMRNILLVGGDKKYDEEFSRELEKNNYNVDVVQGSLEALEYASKRNYDMIISETHMEIMNGIRLIKTIKNMQPMIRTFILTSYSDDTSELEALETDVDQYLVREKSMNVILKYIDKVFASRMTNAGADLLVSLNENIVVDIRKHEVKKDGVLVPLTPKEFGVLRVLLESKGEIFEREEIINRVWGVDVKRVEERMVDIHIKNLRDKLNTYSIVSIRGFGYKWVE